VDINNDGALDLAAMAWHGDTWRVFAILNDGEASFSAEPYATGNRPDGVVLGDLNADGVLDAVVANASAALSVFVGRGDGTFGPQAKFTTGAGGNSVQLGDLDSDSDLDIALVNGSTDDMSVLLNIGNAVFAPQTRVVVGDFPQGLALGDLDQDGDLDAVVANSGTFPAFEGDLNILRNNGNGTFASQARLAVSGRPWGVTLGDVNSDGWLDLVTSHYEIRSTSVRLGQGDGTFAAEVLYNTGDVGDEVTLCDLDGDGHDEMRLIYDVFGPESWLSVWRNNGDGTFATLGAGAVTDFPEDIRCADVDLDGDLDVVLANQHVTVLYNTGQWDFPQQAWFAAGAFPSGVGLGDLDGDGAVDITVSSWLTNDIGVLLNRTIVPGNCPGDLTGDGQVDSGDLAAFIDAFLLQDPTADLTADGQVDSGDLSVFITMFIAGC
jgi:hypothetical protein